MGPGTAASPDQIDLFNTDYTNRDLWKQVLTTELVPQGLNTTDFECDGGGPHLRAQ